MKQIVYICDKCGGAIKGKIDAIDDYTVKTKDHIIVVDGVDLCPKCVNQLKEMLSAWIENEEMSNARRMLDDGKIGALREAGWSLKAIAEEMGCSIQTVSNHLKAMGKEEEDGQV